MKFCHFKIVSGAVDARKWSAIWRNWNISDIFFSLSSIEGRKQRRRPETFAPNMGEIPCEREHGKNMARKWFYRLHENRSDTSDTPCSRSPSGFDEGRLNTLIHNDPRQCTQKLANVINCIHSTIVRHLHLWAWFKIGCMCTACSKLKPQKSGGGHVYISACSSSIDS